MSESRSEMYGSYLALFCFASAMVVVQLFLDSKIGPVLWGLLAWQIYKRNKSTLINTLRLLFWLVVAAGIANIVGFFFESSDAYARRLMQTEGASLAVSAGLFWWIRSFIEKSPTAAEILGTGIAETPAPASPTLAETQVAASYGYAEIQAPASSGYAGILAPAIGIVETPAPTSSDIAEIQVPASAGSATVASPSPAPTARGIRARALARAKQVMFWRKLSSQPKSGGNPPATTEDVADTARPDDNPPPPAGKDRLPKAAVEPAKPAQDAALDAPRTAESAPPLLAPPAVRRPVVESPASKVEPVNVPTPISPEKPAAIPRLTVIDEERCYAEIAQELETGNTDKGLWTRLFAECDGDEKRTRVLYVRQRAERLISAERLRRSQ